MGYEFIIIIILFAGMMWLMGRGGRKAQAAAAEFRANLQVGQNVMTGSGFYGRIVDVDGDVITLESTPGVETMWRRAAIQVLADPPFAVEDQEDDDATVEVPDDASSLAGTPPTAPGADARPAATGEGNGATAAGPGRTADRPDDEDPRAPRT